MEGDVDEWNGLYIHDFSLEIFLLSYGGIGFDVLGG